MSGHRLGEPMYITGMTEKGRALVEALQHAERDVASIWREPYEDYDPKQHLDWMDRQVKAAKVLRALQDQV